MPAYQSPNSSYNRKQ